MNPNVTSVEFSQGNTSGQTQKDDQPKDQIELFFSITDSNCAHGKNYAVSALIVAKKSKEKLDLGKTNHKEGGSHKIDFDKSFITDYYFEIKQVLNLTIFQDEKPMVELETTIGKIMGSRNQNIHLSFNIDGLTGILKVHGIPIKKDDTNITMNILANFGNVKMKPYFIIKRNSSQNQTEFNWIMVYKSEILQDYPKSNMFNPVSLSTQFLCNSNLETQPILIEFYDENHGEAFGGYCASISKILEQNKKDSPLMSPTGGVINDKQINMDCKLAKHYKFLDYIQGGTQISSMVAIDFTASNGIPTEPDSLHTITKKPNLYEMALEACCSIIANYDNDQLYLVFGYGAKVDPTKDSVSHCFPINLTDDPNIFKVEGIMDSYRKFITNPNVKFHGPTFFAPIIKLCTQVAKNVKNFGTYSILTILTDGMINDWDDTIDALVEAANHPLSIIIIGMGADEDEAFSEMKILDSDGFKLTNSAGVRTIRDIVQFVEFDKLKNDPKVLSEKVLEEIPSQLEEFFSLKEIAPGVKKI